MVDGNTIAQSIETNFYLNYAKEAIDLFDDFDKEDISQILSSCQNNALISLMKAMPNDRLAQLVQSSSNERLLHNLEKLPAEKLAKIVCQFDDAFKNQVLDYLSPKKSAEILDILAYPTDTAGYIMDRKVITFFEGSTVSQALKTIKEHRKMGIRILFLVDSEGLLTKMVPIQYLLLENQDKKLLEIARPIPAVALDTETLAEVVSQLESSNLTDLPVVNVDGELIGVIRHHSLITASKEELTLDMQTMVGVSKDERALSKILFAVRKRLPWLEINLLTAFMASGVVALFESTIAQYTALAVMLPIVAGQSGNTGAQALAVTMRGLTLKEVRLSHGLFLILKEARIAFITGFVVSITTAIGIFLWSRSLGLALIITISMIISMVLAGMSGALVPLLFTKLKMDPAQSSSIVLTTITDIVGFFSFLTIASSLSKFI